MRKFAAIILTIVFTTGMAVAGYAAKADKKEKKYERIVAQVVSVDTAANTMVVTREENGETRTVSISAKAASQVHPGDRVRIKLKPGTNESAGVRVLGAKPAAVDATASEPAVEPEAQAK